MEFKSFGEIKRLDNVQMTITQKMHGMNASICIWEEPSDNPDRYPDEIKIKAGSRTRWIYPGDDNYGFAGWVEANKEVLIKTLGVGRHDGEYCGPGINSGEGFKVKTFILFDFWRYLDENQEVKPLPSNVILVPLLYRGPLNTNKISEVMEDLKTNGSKLVPGFMRPEGIVIEVGGHRYKKVFEAEDTQWKQGSKDKEKLKKLSKETVDYSHLCQPIRLEKLLSRDEDYIRNYPKSLPQIVKDYMADLIKEDQIIGDEDYVRGVQKAASGQIFKFVKTMVDEVAANERI